MIAEIYNNKDKNIDFKAKIFIIALSSSFSDIIQDKSDLEFFKKEKDLKKDLSYLKSSIELKIFVSIPEDIIGNNGLEFARKKASEAYALLKVNNFDEVELYSNNPEFESAFFEGLLLSSYQFDKFKEEKEAYSLKKIYSHVASDEIVNVIKAVFWARDLVNEPPAHQTATNLANEFERMAADIDGLNVEVFNKIQIESLRMGGLLSINRGSVQAPTFSVITWKPENAVNSKPIVLVGKGVVYDTGGINLKPTGFLETMKSDMSGSAVVSALLKAVASNNLPVYVIALIPATDNRPGGDAIVPGDVITMMSGKTVEIINTDAEGRMILADGLSYSNKFEPELVFSVATLTGAAARIFGSRAFVSMGNTEKDLKSMSEASFITGERCWELPFWDDFSDELKSSIADIKHLGGVNGGAITAGKFLENFTSAPYIHLDIAGVSFNEKAEDYKPIGGTGTGVRALFRFIKKYISEKGTSS